jgi:hypothetical protein
MSEIFTPVTAAQLREGDRFTYLGNPGHYVDTVDHVYTNGAIDVDILFVRDGKAERIRVARTWNLLRVDAVADLSSHSDVLLAADIELVERTITTGWALGNDDALRYRQLVTERHARTLARGAEQAARLLYVEKMLEEIAAFSVNGETGVDGWSFEVDDVVRDEEGRILTILGTAVEIDNASHTPYILGEV